MRFTINAPSITQPTYQTLRDYTRKRFQKIGKFLKKKDKTNHEIRIGVERVGNLFEMVAEIFHPVHLVVKTKQQDLKKAVDMLSDQLKRKVRRFNGKQMDKRKRGFNGSKQLDMMQNE